MDSSINVMLQSPYFGLTVTVIAILVSFYFFLTREKKVVKK